MAAPQPTMFKIESFYGPVHVAMTWGAHRGPIDMDLSACAYDAGGNQIDVAYFKKPTALNGAITGSGDNQTGIGYGGDKEGFFIHPSMVPENVNFIFFIATTQTGAFQGTGCGVRFSDGQVATGRALTGVSLDHVPQTACLAAVLIRSPAHEYPRGWNLHVTAAYPVAHGPGRDFNEAQPLIEEYLRSSVPPHLLANRPPNNPMEQCDLSKTSSYVLHPSVRRLQMGLGWSSACDLDAHCYIFDDWYQKVSHVYRNNLRETGIYHSGNDTNGLGGDPNRPDETIFIDLDQVSPAAKHIVFYINIRQGEQATRWVNRDGVQVQETYRLPRPHGFAGIPYTFCQMVDTNNGQILCHYPLSIDATPGVTRIMCSLTRFGDRQWSLTPLGTAHQQDPVNSEVAREMLVRVTRQDLMRPVRITFGVIKGSDLMACDSNGKSDPLFSAKFFDGTCKKTDKIKKTLNPEWNQPGLYQWTGPVVALLDRINAKLDVYDWDRFSNDFMGRAFLHIRDVVGTRGRGPQQKTLALGPKDGASGSHKYKGTITVQWTCEASY